MMAASNTLSNDESTSGQDTLSLSLSMIKALVDICENNCNHFECDKTEAGQRFFCAFRNIIDHAALARTIVIEVTAFMHEYDFDESVPANGYRSMVNVMHACINYTVKICKYIAKNHGYLLFRKTVYIK